MSFSLDALPLHHVLRLPTTCRSTTAWVSCLSTVNAVPATLITRTHRAARPTLPAARPPAAGRYLPAGGLDSTHPFHYLAYRCRAVTGHTALRCARCHRHTWQTAHLTRLFLTRLLPPVQTFSPRFFGTTAPARNQPACADCIPSVGRRTACRYRLADFPLPLFFISGWASNCAAAFLRL